jgi:hypothetical protein
MSCRWHWLKAQPIDVQVEAANKRLAQHLGEPVARVPLNICPGGERWCAGCQSFVPLFYASGSRCRACASQAAHASRIRSTYGLSGEDYERLLMWQGGVCYICHRVPRSKRLAVDHDHVTGKVRGLLCADSERGCNHALLGNITSVEMAQRIVNYLTAPPYERMDLGEPPDIRRDTHRQQLERMIFGGRTREEFEGEPCDDPKWHPDWCGCLPSV